MQIKRFGWVKRPSHWEFAQAWRAQRSGMVQRFRDDAAVANSAFLNAQNNLSMGLASLAAQASIMRTQNELAAVKSQITANSVNLLA
jgi:hypothetical protein